MPSQGERPVLGFVGVTDIDDQGRPQPPSNGDEQTTLVGFLEFQRATFLWKCSGLDAAGLSAKVASSSMTLGGIMKHLALVEVYWFSEWLHGRESREPWSEIDWTADPDWEWRSAGDDSPEDLHSLWLREVENSRVELNEALAAGGLGQLAVRKGSDGGSPSVRWILCHMIEEYARHNGHADIIRESVDGSTGE
jgi:uncharacterized damage-inducible protein DinB